MNTEGNSSKELQPSEVARQVFEQFLAALADANTPPAVVDRLRALLLSEKSLTEKATTEAIFSDAPQL